jgi:hypothetical protein
MVKKKHKRVSAQSLLEALDELLQTSRYYQSRESGKRFYDQGSFPSLLASYITHSGKNVRQNARQFGMSPGTLENIIAGGPLSDNMLLRIRSALIAETTALAKQAIFPGDWQTASPTKVSNAIADVSGKLVFLKKVIAGSNFLNSEDSPIDKIQVLQLVALLTATLDALRAPFIDKKQTSGFFRWLAKLAKTSAEKGIEKLVVDAMGDAASAGTDLIHHLSGQSGITDLGNIIT